MDAKIFGHHPLGQGKIYISLVQYGLTSVNSKSFVCTWKKENVLER